METEYYLELSENPLRFEAGNQLTNVFFDESNKHVFVVRSGGVLGVVVKTLNECSSLQALNFRMEDRGDVLSIKFSLDFKILAVHRNNFIEFMTFNGNTLESEFSHSCQKNSQILGFLWTFHNELAFVTDHGVELFKVIPEKKTLKSLKVLSVPIQWFIWSTENKIALLASAHGSQLQPVLFKPGSVIKLPKVENAPSKITLERDISLASLYDTPALLILRHPNGVQNAEVHIHLLGNTQAFTKQHVLKLGLSGRFAINIVDNLILVHHQASRSSQIFDISLPGASDGTVKYHTSIAPARSFKPATLSVPGITESEKQDCELYSPNWVVFQPNIIIDAKLGCLWHIDLCLYNLCSLISDLEICTQVLLKRTNGKDVLLKILLQSIRQEKPNLDKIRASLIHINKNYRDSLEADIQIRTALLPNEPIPDKIVPYQGFFINQTDIYNEILLKLDHENETNKLEWILICYLSSLHELIISPQHNINELLLTTLVRKKKFTTLQQLLQYGVVADSKALACLLLSLGNVYSSATQLALDMLSRLGAKDEIKEILLSQDEILTALKLSEDTGNLRKFLQAVQDSKDEILFHSVLYYFRNNPQYLSAFKKDERLNSFIHHYNKIFDDKNENGHLNGDK